MSNHLSKLTAAVLALAVAACESPVEPVPFQAVDGSTAALFGGSLDNLDEVWFQGFETDATGWLDGDDAWHGSAVQVASGTSGVTSSTGSAHAVFNGNGTSGPFSQFDGYRDVWPGAWVAEVDVYLDPAWSTGQGFDYSVAATGSDGLHQRDYIFHVGVHADGRLLVNGSNNSDFTVNDFKLLNDGDGTPYEVTTAGWYTLQHVFYEDAGSLSVDLNLLDDQGNIVFTTTRSNAGDTIGPAGEVGGNRYAWFTFITATDLPVDNHRLGIVLPVPGNKDDCKNGGWIDFGFKNQGQCIASLQANENAGKG